MKEEPSHHHHVTYLGGYDAANSAIQRQSPSPSPLMHQATDRTEDMDSNSGTKSELRKSNKPIMEKRRRARINNCLNDLKAILLEAMRKDPARHSKLEKADILELTVRHLQTVQRNQLAIAMASDPTVLHRFKNGFSECATEVSRYLGRLDIGDPGIKNRVSSHLNGCISGLQQVNPSAPPGGISAPHRFNLAPPVPHISFAPPSPPLQIPPQTVCPAPNPGDPNNNKAQTQQQQRLQIQPPSPIQPPNLIELRHNSAFTSLVPPPGSFIASPAISTTSSDTLNTSLSSGSDSSSLSFSSSDKGLNTSPIDFSLKPPSATPRILNVEPPNATPRILKVEPLGRTSSMDKGHMWRPW